MNKYLYPSVIAFTVLGLVSCSANKDDHYYRQHPKELQQALKTCREQQNADTHCEKIKQLGGHLANLAYQLQYNPQGFGHKILSLQQTIAQQQLEIKNTSSSALKESLAQNKAELADYLAVVKWLESPES